MDTANPLNTVLKQILNGGNANHLYAVTFKVNIGLTSKGFQWECSG